MHRDGDGPARASCSSAAPNPLAMLPGVEPETLPSPGTILLN
jgi:hypothetical protein